MNLSNGKTVGDQHGIWVPSEDFARYAEEDLDRWRQLIGYHVQHHDSRWGIGIVEAVSWGSPCEHVPAFVQVRIRYEAGWTIMAHSATWHLHHRQALVPAQIETVIRLCLDESLSEDEKEDCLARHSHEIREQRDRRTLQHVKDRQQAATRRATRD